MSKMKKGTLILHLNRELFMKIERLALRPITVALLCFGCLGVADASAASIKLPSKEVPVTVVANDVFSTAGAICYFYVTVDGIPENGNYDLENGVYEGWCVNSTLQLPNNRRFPARLFSSYADTSALPGDLQYPSETWRKINWVINHRDDYLRQTAEAWDVEDAIWYIIDELPGPFAGEWVYTIKQDADEYGSQFVPTFGEKMAVICAFDPSYDNGLDLQDLIIEVKIPPPSVPVTLSSLAGFVYVDANNNGVKDAGEAGIAGTTLNLSGTDNLGTTLNLSATTAADGSYVFPDLHPSGLGGYTITETQPGAYLDGKDTIGSPGGVAANDVFSAITLKAGVAGADNNFGELKPGSLAGYVYLDANNDGSRAAGEAGIVATVKLSGTDDLGGAVSAETSSNDQGAYSFVNLRPGTYVITETQPSGYLDGKDTIGTPGGVAGNDQFGNVALAAGVDGVNNNFGELKPGSLAGYVYLDANNDGIRAAGEAGIVATVKLSGTDDLGGAVSAETSSNDQGAYSFVNLRPGTYVITETQPSGYLDGKDTIGTPGGVTGNDQFGNVALAAGVDGVNNNFGELKPGSLAGYVYLDANNDGSRAAGEAGIVATVKLSGTDDLGGAVSAETSSNDQGAYSFVNLRPGTYVITETQPSGYLDGKDTIGTPGGVTGNDQFGNVALAAGVDGVNNNFGELKPGSLAGYVYLDANNDGSRAAGEAGIVATVKLSGTDDLGGAVSAETSSNDQGAYSFVNLRPGTYVITETQPSGYLDGKDTIGTPGGVTGNDQFDNVALAAGVDGVNNNFGELKPGSLAGYVYLDANNDGSRAAGEAGIVATVKLSGTDDLGGAVSAETSSNDQGAYSFVNLRPGTYVITETQPSGYLDGKDTIGTPGGVTGNDQFGNVALAAGVDGVNNNFGELKPGSLAGYVYLDANNDGSRAAGEAGIVATVKLSGTDDLGGAVSAETSSNDQGAYSFVNLRPGTYVITETQPSGYLDGKDTIGTPGGVTGNDQFDNVALAAGVDGVNNNFGELKPGSLAGYVYLDANNDGSRAAGEAGIVATVKLSGTDDLGGAVSAETSSNDQGAYSFVNLRPGTYVITETHPSGYLDGKDTIGTPGGVAGNDQFDNVALAAGVDGVNNNFGELKPGSLAGYVYLDANNDGSRAAGEAGIVATVKLSGTDDLGGAVSAETSSNDQGAYSFVNLRPGTYVITETQPSGYLDGKDTIGTPGGVTGNDQFGNVALAAGVDGVNNNFGELKPGSLAGYVYLDANNDGSRAAGEAGIVATVKLSGTDDLGGAVSAETSSNDQGAYSFVNLRPGTYVITETQPSGYLDGKDTIGTPGGVAGNDQFGNVALAAGVDGVNNNFGELLSGSLSGFVYYDADNDGSKDTGEAAIKATVTLTGTDDLGKPVSATIESAADTGAYSFTDLRPGTYAITETQPAGYLDGKDTIGTPGGTATNDKFSEVALGAGVNGVNNNFGELLSGSLSGFVYYDADNDGSKDTGEAAIKATVTLTGTDDLGKPVSATIESAADTGAYSFTDLRPGTYAITETQPAGYLDGKDTIGTPGGTATNDKFSEVALGAGVNGANNNFGELLSGSLSGFVYYDADNDGSKDTGEAAIKATVTLTGTDDLGKPVSATIESAADTGAYSFTDLRPGTYAITETQPAGYLDGKDTIGTPGGTATNDKFSEVALGAGVNGVNNNFGELLSGSLSGFVYYDADNDGSKDTGEAAIKATVTLTGTDDLGKPVSATIESAADTGAYSFTDLRPGTYAITETQPAGYLDGKDTIGTPGGTATNDKFSEVALGAGVNGANNNFGELLSGSLSGFVYYDADNDGSKDTGEAAIKATVTLTGTDDLGKPVSATIESAADTGAYSFTDLRPGTYAITETQPAGYLDGKDTIGTPGGTATNDKFSEVALGAGVNGVNNNFGELLSGSLSGFVYYDADNDGSKDTGEAAIKATVTLTGTDDLGKPVSATIESAADTGAYSFTDLRPGTYAITETQPAGYLDGKDTIGTPGGTATNDKFSEVALGAGVNGANNNFGELLSGSLSGFVYYDADNDGSKDTGEAAIKATVTLTGTDDLGKPVSATIESAADTGAYSFRICGRARTRSPRRNRRVTWMGRTRSARRAARRPTTNSARWRWGRASTGPIIISANCSRGVCRASCITTPTTMGARIPARRRSKRR